MIRFVPRDFSGNTINPTAAQIQDLTDYTDKQRKKATEGALLSSAGISVGLLGNKGFAHKVISDPGFSPTNEATGTLGKLVDKINEDPNAEFESKYGSFRSTKIGPAVHLTGEVREDGSLVKEIINSKDDDKYIDPGYLAHEYGHTLQNDALRTYGTLTSAVGDYVSPLIGVIAANRQEKAARKGKKLGWIGRNEQWIIPAALQAPRLAIEAGASIRGYNVLKDLGATKEELKGAANSTGTAFGTYVTQAMIPVAASLVTHQLIKRRRRLDELKDLKLAKAAAIAEETPDEKVITG